MTTDELLEHLGGHLWRLWIDQEDGVWVAHGYTKLLMSGPDLESHGATAKEALDKLMQQLTSEHSPP